MTRFAALRSARSEDEAAVVAREGLASLTSSEETTREDGSFDELHAEERLAALVTLCLHEADDALASAKASSRRLARCVLCHTGPRTTALAR